MYPGRFEYQAPTALEEAFATLDRYGDEAKVLAGGQSLVPLLNLRLATPSHLVDVMGIEELRGIDRADGWLCIRAGVRQAQAEDDTAVREGCPLLREALPHIAHREIRNAGTVCGSAAHGDAASEIPAVALAAGAEFDVAGPAGTRTLEADDFYTGYLSTLLEPDELLTAVRFREPSPGTGTAFLEVAQRTGDYALVGVAASVCVEAGRVASARIAYLGVESVPTRVPAAEQLLAGAEPGEEAFAEAAAVAARELHSIGGIHASAAYRKDLAATLTRRALATATERAGAA
jgi:aerobic carbon-monoxide dehydrogenase medium subunit